jgi:hypothetical protein
MKIFTVLLYDIALLAGTAYLVQFCGWSMWTFLLAALFFVTLETKKAPE